MTAPPIVSRALHFLGVLPSEERSAALMTGHSFFMGCSTVFFETAATATFLSRFDSSYLPWVYIAAAGVNTVTGTAYARVQRTMSFARLMKGTLWFLLALVAAVRIGFAASSVAWVAFAGLVSYRIVSSLTDLEYWAVASRIYDVRQAKRLFGLVGTGEVVARIVGSFCVPLFVPIFGVPNLLLLSATGLALCLVLLRAVLKPVQGVASVAGAELPQKQKTQGLREGLRAIFASRYLSLVVGVAVLATFGKYFVDFAFLEQTSTITKGEAELATILGLFNGLTQTLSLLTRIFISRPLLHRFGIRVGVLILPALHALCAAATVASGALGAGSSVVFWTVIANQGVYKTFKHPIDNASFKVLYQPLKPQQRLAAQIAVEIIFSPVIVGLAGGVMLLFSAVWDYDPVRFSIVLLVNFVAWVVAARAAGRAYVRALLDMLKKRIEGNVTLPFDDATTLSVLRARLDSAAPDEICAALDLLEKAGAPDLKAVLIARVGHSSPEVRQYALERLLELYPESLRDLRRTLSLDPEPSVRRAAMRAVAVGAGDLATEELLPHLKDPDRIVRRAAVEVLVGLRDARGVAAARAAVEDLAASDVAEDRALAGALAGEHGWDPVLLSLLSDRDPDVVRATLAAAGSHDENVHAALLEHLRDPRFAQATATALAKNGVATIQRLEPIFKPETDRLMLRRLVYVYRRVGGRAGVDGLRMHMSFPDVAVRGRVLAALEQLAYSADGDDEKGAVRAQLRQEAREVAWTLSAWRDLRGEPSLVALRSALEDEVLEARRRVLHLLSFVHDRVAIRRAADHLAHASKDKRAYAHEVLDLVLDADEREELLPLLDVATMDERVRRSSALAPQPAASAIVRLRELVSRPEAFLGGWTRALAIQAAVERSAPGLEEALARLGKAHPVVNEVAAWATAKLRGKPQEGGGRMLLIEKVIILKTVPMFAKTSEELLAEIAGTIEEVEYEAGQTVFAKGDPGDSMYIVVTGRVRVVDGDSTLSELGEKEIFGELALLDPKPRSASVTVIEAARLFRLDGDVFSQLMAGSIDIVRGVLHVLCERLRRTSADASRA